MLWTCQNQLCRHREHPPLSSSTGRFEDRMALARNLRAVPRPRTKGCNHPRAERDRYSGVGSEGQIFRTTDPSLARRPDAYPDVDAYATGLYRRNAGNPEIYLSEEAR